MIDGVGKAGAGRLELVRSSVERTASAGGSSDVLARQQAAGASSPFAEMAASGPPVDAGKVAAIRAAIAEGRYPLDPQKIAAAMLALDLPQGGGE
jgi:negative regulator of flagellin synthesis FlgM